MKDTFLYLSLLAVVCSGAALPHTPELARREPQGDFNERDVTVVVTITQTVHSSTVPPATSTVFTTASTPVIIKTITVTKPASSQAPSTSVVTVTKPTTVPGQTVTVTVTTKPTTSKAAPPPVTITVTVDPPDDNSATFIQITRTLPGLTLNGREASPVPEPQWHTYSPGGPVKPTTIYSTTKETTTYWHPSTKPEPSTSTVYYTVPAPPNTSRSTTYITTTFVPTYTAPPATVTETHTQTAKTVIYTTTYWDAAKGGKRSPQTLGVPTRTVYESPTPVPTSTSTKGWPWWWPHPTKSTTTSAIVTTYAPPPSSPTGTRYTTGTLPLTVEERQVLGSPTRTVIVSPTAPAQTSTAKPTSTKKPFPPWWWPHPHHSTSASSAPTVTYYTPAPSPTGTRYTTGSLPLTVEERQVLGSPTRTVNVSPTPIKTSTVKPTSTKKATSTKKPHTKSSKTTTSKVTKTSVIYASGTLPVVTLY